jgi:hypothetical protein
MLILEDVWFGAEDALVDICPALFSHCTHKDATVRQVMDSGIVAHLVPRLSTRASQELSYVEGIVAQINLSSEPDCRTSRFGKGDASLDSGSINKLLKARGQPNDERASFIWNNAAPLIIQMFMWLLVQGRI